MLERCVGDQRAVVQFEDGETLSRAASGRQLANPIVGYQFAVRERLEGNSLARNSKNFEEIFSLQVSPSLDIRWPDGPALDPLFDCTPPDPFAPSICSSAMELK